MARIVLLLSVNLDHSEVRKRRVLAEGLPALLATLRGAPIPVTLAIQRRDIELAGVTDEDLEGLDVLAGPYAHGMEGLLVGPSVASSLEEHCRWQVENGYEGTVAGTFRPEFSDALRQGVHKEGQIFPCLAGNASSWYTSVGGGFTQLAEPSQQEAIRFRGQIWTPMAGVMGLVRGYQLFQRYPDNLNGDEAMAFVQVLRAYAQSGDEIRFLPMDVEAALVGSHHGLGVWDRFFQLLVEHDLTGHFASFAEAEARWRTVAVDASTLVHGGGELLLPTRNEAKWRSWRPQFDYLAELNQTLRYSSAVGHVLASIATSSDVFSCMSGMLNPTPVRLPADRGDLVIQGTWDMQVLGHAALSALTGVDALCGLQDGEAVAGHEDEIHIARFSGGVTRQHKAGRLTDDGLWYAQRIIERCLQPRLG